MEGLLSASLSNPTEAVAAVALQLERLLSSADGGSPDYHEMEEAVWHVLGKVPLHSLSAYAESARFVAGLDQVASALGSSASFRELLFTFEGRVRSRQLPVAQALLVLQICYEGYQGGCKPDLKRPLTEQRKIHLIRALAVGAGKKSMMQSPAVVIACLSLVYTLWQQESGLMSSVETAPGAAAGPVSPIFCCLQQAALCIVGSALFTMSQQDSSVGDEEAWWATVAFSFASFLLSQMGLGGEQLLEASLHAVNACAVRGSAERAGKGKGCLHAPSWLSCLGSSAALSRSCSSRDRHAAAAAAAERERKVTEKADGAASSSDEGDEQAELLRKQAEEQRWMELVYSSFGQVCFLDHTCESIRKGITGTAGANASGRNYCKGASSLPGGWFSLFNGDGEAGMALEGAVVVPSQSSPSAHLSPLSVLARIISSLQPSSAAASSSAAAVSPSAPPAESPFLPAVFSAATLVPALCLPLALSLRTATSSTMGKSGLQVAGEQQENGGMQVEEENEAAGGSEASDMHSMRAQAEAQAALGSRLKQKLALFDALLSQVTLNTLSVLGDVPAATAEASSSTAAAGAGAGTAAATKQKGKVAGGASAPAASLPAAQLFGCPQYDLLEQLLSSIALVSDEPFRQHAFRTLKAFLSRFNPQARYFLLSEALLSCRFSDVRGFLLDYTRSCAAAALAAASAPSSPSSSFIACSGDSWEERMWVDPLISRRQLELLGSCISGRLSRGFEPQNLELVVEASIKNLTGGVDAAALIGAGTASTRSKDSSGPGAASSLVDARELKKAVLRGKHLQSDSHTDQALCSYLWFLLRQAKAAKEAGAVPILTGRFLGHTEKAYLRPLAAAIAQCEQVLRTAQGIHALVPHPSALAGGSIVATGRSQDPPALDDQEHVLSTLFLLQSSLSPALELASSVALPG